jgi:hypothetical protein
MLSCEGLECFRAAKNCVGNGNGGDTQEGDGNTVFSAGNCSGWNPGLFIRLQCQK